jgi:phage-related protein (TIGR01555 family)
MMPRKKTKTYVEAVDNLVNLISGLGTDKDKRMHSHYVPRSIGDAELTTLYEESWLHGQAIDLPANDATRKWRTLKVSGDDHKRLVDTERELHLQAQVNEAAKFGRLHGGALQIWLVDNTGELDEPLDHRTIKQGAKIISHVFEKSEVRAGDIDHDPYSPNFGYPESYTLVNRPDPKTGQDMIVHHTRCVRYDGLVISRKRRKVTKGWNLSILQRMHEQLTDVASFAASIIAMTNEAKNDIMGIEGLMEKIASDHETSALIKRLASFDRLKSILNMSVIDPKYESLSTRELSFSGVASLFPAIMSLASAATNIPVTRLFGTSAKGLNATGEGDLRDYFNGVESEQENFYRERITAADRIWVPTVLGSFPDDWDYEFDNLWILTELEEVQVGKTRAEQDEINIRSTVIEPSMAAHRLQATNEYPGITDEYVAQLEEFEEEDRQAEPAAPIGGETGEEGLELGEF